jgi:hypothetical protein
MMNFIQRIKDKMSEKKKGRPVKEDPNKDYSSAVIKNLTDTAIGLSKLSDGKYAVIKIKYNPISGEVGNQEISLLDSPTANDAEYDFRDEVDQMLDNDIFSKN